LNAEARKKVEKAFDKYLKTFSAETFLEQCDLYSEFQKAQNLAVATKQTTDR
jgi:hypothetical protein